MSNPREAGAGDGIPPQRQLPPQVGALGAKVQNIGAMELMGRFSFGSLAVEERPPSLKESGVMLITPSRLCVASSPEARGLTRRSGSWQCGRSYRVGGGTLDEHRINVAHGHQLIDIARFDRSAY